MPEQDAPGWDSNPSSNFMIIKRVWTMASNPLPLKYLRMNDYIHYPAIVIEDTFISIFVTKNNTIVKIIDPQGILMSVKGNVIQPGIDMLMALLIDHILFWHSADTIGV